MPQEYDANETFDFDDQVNGEFIKVSTITTRRAGGTKSVRNKETGILDLESLAPLGH